jgi:hypothetical protein
MTDFLWCDASQDGVRKMVASLVPQFLLNISILARTRGSYPTQLLDSEHQAVESGNLLNRCRS